MKDVEHFLSIRDYYQSNLLYCIAAVGFLVGSWSLGRDITVITKGQFRWYGKSLQSNLKTNALVLAYCSNRFLPAHHPVYLPRVQLNKSGVVAFAKPPEVPERIIRVMSIFKVIFNHAYLIKRWLLRNQSLIWNVGIGLCIALDSLAI